MEIHWQKDQHVPKQGSWEAVGICGTHEAAGRRRTVELEVGVSSLVGFRSHRSSNTRLRAWKLVLGAMKATGGL